MRILSNHIQMLFANINTRSYASWMVSVKHTEMSLTTVLRITLNLMTSENCLRKSEGSVERISVCNVTEKWRGMSSSYTNDVINMLP